MKILYILEFIIIYYIIIYYIIIYIKFIKGELMSLLTTR